MTVACGVDADADAVEGGGCRHEDPPENGKRAGWEATKKQRSHRGMPVSFLREFFGEVILVISGQSRRMYQSLEPKSGGTNLFKEVNASWGKTGFLTTLP